MTVAQLVILPGILIAVFLGVILWLLGKPVRSKISMMTAEKAAAEAPPALLRQQALAIMDVIAEIETNQLSYTAFPEKLKTELLDAHAAWSDPQGKGKRRTT
jgi:hypothetical protein